MNSQRTANLLTICIKAGKAVKGFDSACESVKNGTAYCILTASDASEKTVKETEFICKKYSVPVLKTRLSKEEIGNLCGKVTAVIAVCDRGFADGFIKINN
ncbi:MAG: 50S ribosomal protein L7ae [Ruminococcus sp.]|nr:50S ribosomal protein L7ae [Ruminococcus sp.]